jgi:uncharacterized RmlC-like cupin family protein
MNESGVNQYYSQLATLLHCVAHLPPLGRVIHDASLRRRRVADIERRNWRTDGVKVIKSDRLDSNTAQTPGMLRAAAVNFARVGSQKLWAGTVLINPNARTGAHHHGALESVIYVVRGAARMRWGERLEFVATADAGDFIFVPPYVPHQEINALSDTPLECVLVRSDNQSVVVNLNIDAAERVEEVYWIDPVHRDPAP